MAVPFVCVCVCVLCGGGGPHTGGPCVSALPRHKWACVGYMGPKKSSGAIYLPPGGARTGSEGVYGRITVVMVLEKNSGQKFPIFSSPAGLFE